MAKENMKSENAVKYGIIWIERWTKIRKKIYERNRDKKNIKKSKYG